MYTKMSAFDHLLFCLLFCISVYISPTHATDKCVKKTPCSCEFSNGTGIDLSESAKSTFYSAQILDQNVTSGKFTYSTYYFHPCFDVKSINFNGTNCGVELALCRHTDWDMEVVNGTLTNYSAAGRYEEFGKSDTTEFSDDGKTIKYIHGPSNNSIILVCAETEDKLYVTSTEDRNIVYLTFFSRNACLRQLEVIGRSTGSTLLIIFFSCVIFYLVLGVCTKKFLMGATGIEVVPNLAFWSELPNLVKDGWAFAVNGFKLPVRGPGPVSSPDPNSYDSI